nr:hypothetical protein [Kibdelosporangium sp. MJ126-NF4]CEL22520.1 hypothetical protein [Kibdelosporangium sp. MJ126-NF4]CTQ89376.1 hypothetical protein [Kibdelosporangium sp. MJ126-NF4]
MRPKLVFVHGIGGPRQVDQERHRWTAALADGMRKAGHSDIAEDLANSDSPEIEFAYYGDLFTTPHAQGGDASLSATNELQLVSELFTQILAELETGDERLRLIVERATEELHPHGTPQGAGDVLRRLINAATTLLSVGPFALAGQWLSARLLVRDLAQVARYLARAEPDEDGSTLDRRVRDRVDAALGDDPAIVVAHSLGSVVSYEVLHCRRREIPLLVTLGSPLLMRSVVWPRVRPQPPRTPEQVRRWANFWDRDDIIVARPRLEADMLANSLGVLPASGRVDSDGAWVHTATKYLAHADVGGPVAETIRRLRRSDE